MIGYLPKSIEVNGIDRPIRSDFRVILLIFEAFNDPECSQEEKIEIMFECLYEDFESIPQEDTQEAVEKASWFIDGGGEVSEGNKDTTQPKKLMDWQQDERYIFSAINKQAGYETRAVEYLHWWSFLGFFNEIGEGLFSTIISIRTKKSKGKKLDKLETEFYNKNKSMIDLKEKLSVEEQEIRDKLNKMLG